jgi:MarR family transcriptional regulator, organic hydroperoxide resistance regulator
MKTSESRYCSCIYFSSAAFARKIEKIAVESWKPVGLAPSHGYLLMCVIDEPGIQPGCLADQLQLQPSTITRLIEKLEEKKLVVRTTEGKLTNVYPTPKSKEMYGKLKECTRNFHDACTGMLGKEETCRLVSIMNKMADKFED